MLYAKLMFVPFFQPTFDDEDEEDQASAKKKKKGGLPVPPARAVTMNVQDRLKVGRQYGAGAQGRWAVRPGGVQMQVQVYWCGEG